MIAAFEIALLFCDKPIRSISRSIVLAAMKRPFGAKPVKFSSARGFGSPQVASWTYRTTTSTNLVCLSRPNV
jgi:hypothetical protein